MALLAISRRLLLTVFIVDLMALVSDTTMTWSSPTILKLQSKGEDNPLGYLPSTDEIAWVVSIINIGAIVGPLPISYVAKKRGRKFAILLTSTSFTISYVILAFSGNIICFYVARFIAGIGLGATCAILPMYISEIAEDSNRGLLSVSLNMFWTLGSLVPYVLGPFIPYWIFNCIFAIFPVIFIILACCILPETPYYLIQAGRYEEAERVLQKLREQDDVYLEMREIQYNLEDNPRGSISEFCKNKASARALFISLMLIIIQQASGINAIIFYTETIFTKVGTGLAPEISAIIVGSVFFVSSVIITILSDSFNRRVFLTCSALGTTISMSILGVYFYLKDEDYEEMHMIVWLPIVSIILFFITYNMGLAALPWTISSELFTAQLKHIGSSLVSFTCWLASFIVTQFFEKLIEAIGEAFTFWMFACIGAVSIIFILLFVPETRRKSFSVIQVELQR